jgi:arylsulfatase A-like enzyme
MTVFRHLIAAAALSALAAPPLPAAGHPNILFFLVDDMGTTDTSVHFLHDAEGRDIEAPLNKRYRTPHMEALARQGIKFTNAHAYSVCTPTRAALMSGQEAGRLHITTWTDPKKPIDTGAINKNGISDPKWRMSGLDTALPTLPKLLSAAGYRTIHCGKAHFGPDSTPAGDPKNIGFQVNIAGSGAGGPGSYWGKKNFSAAWRKGGHKWDVPGLGKYHGQDIFLTEALTREMSAAIADAVKQKTPFFAYMAHYAVHAPFETDARFAKHYPNLKGKALAFATMVEGMDKSLGDLIATLEKLGVAEDTLVVFYSDNGSDGPLNLPLRGKKGTRFDGGSRVPMIVAWAKPNPANPLQKALPVPRGATSDDLVAPADFLPTLARIAGAGIPKSAVIDGHDITPCIRAIPGTHHPQQFLLHFPNGRHNNVLFTTWIDGDWKLIYQYLDKSWQLTNLAYDIGEKKNLVAEKPELALALAKRMIARMDRIKAQYPVEKKTGRPIKPDLSALKEACKKKSASPAPPPIPEDTLDLASMIQPVAPENIYRDKGWYTWCNSIIKGEDGKYHLFYVRWPKKYGFGSWLTHSEIARATSDHPAGPYTFVEQVIPSRGKFGWNQFNAHNVKIKRFGGKYYLYFIGCNDGGIGLTEDDMVATARAYFRAKHWMRLRNNQRTGAAVADSVAGPWKILDRPVIEPNGPISTVTVNPAIWQAPDGRFMMIVKGDYPPSRFGEALAVSDSPTGPFHIQPDLVFDRYSEDVSAWSDPARGLTYGILHDRKGFGTIVTKDGFHWQDARHFRAINKKIPKASGGFLTPTRFERPSVFFENGAPRVLGGAAQFQGGKDACILLIPLSKK